MEKLNRVILSLGSNIEDRAIHLMTAVQKISEKAGRIIHKSAIYESKAVGFISDTPFFNMCVEIETNLSADTLLLTTQEIEIEIGRKSKTTAGYESRKIDIDIIFYSNLIVDGPRLSIPHKNYSNRKFVLIPLCEINEKTIDPLNGSTMAEILKNCEDKSTVKRTTVVI